MPLRLAPDALSLIRAAKNDILLGIMTADDEVRLTVSGPHLPGHREWLQQSPLAARRGFSLIVKDGSVFRFSPLSGLNPDPHALLEPELVARVLALLPLAPDYQVETP